MEDPEDWCDSGFIDGPTTLHLRFRIAVRHPVADRQNLSGDKAIPSHYIFLNLESIHLECATLQNPICSLCNFLEVCRLKVKLR